MLHRNFTIAAILVVASQSLIATDPSWLSFRGPTGMGIAELPSVTTIVDKSSNLKWRTPLKGVGWSSPVTNGKHIWMTSAIATEATAEQKAAKLAGVQFAEMKDVAGRIELFAQCVDAQTGDVLVQRSLAVIEDPNPIHPMNSYASPTPLLVGDRVVCHFGGYGTWCLEDSTGKTLWNQRLVFNDSVGPGSSPVRAGNLALIVCDGIDQQFVAALDLSDGSVQWKTARPPMQSSNGEFHKAYCTPLMIKVGEQSQAVIPGAQWIVAYAPQLGKELWRINHGEGFSTTPMPIYSNGTVIFSTGYMVPELLAVDPSGQGDVTDTHVRWRVKRGIPAKPSPITDGKLVYLISDDGIATAVNIDDGATVWRKRIGGTFSASPLLSGKNLFIGNHEGELTILETGNVFRQVNQVDLDEQIMASPTPFGEDLLIRTKDALYRFGS